MPCTVRGDEADAGLSSPLNVFPGLDEPGGHIVECAAALAERCNPAHLGALLFALELRTTERRIAEHVGAVFRRQQCRPVGFQGIGVPDMRRAFQRNAYIALTGKSLLSMTAAVNMPAFTVTMPAAMIQSCR